MPGWIGNIHGMFALRAPPAGRHPLPAAIAPAPARRGSLPERGAARSGQAAQDGGGKRHRGAMGDGLGTGDVGRLEEATRLRVLASDGFSPANFADAFEN